MTRPLRLEIPNALYLLYACDGSPHERIWNLMEKVMLSGMARHDLAIWHWAQSDVAAKKVFERVLDKGFSFAKWTFGEAGFSLSQTEARSRMMVVYMLGESTLFPESIRRTIESIKIKHSILTGQDPTAGEALFAQNPPFAKTPATIEPLSDYDETP